MSEQIEHHVGTLGNWSPSASSGSSSRRPTEMRYVAKATIVRRATAAEIDKLEAWLDRNAARFEREAWRSPDEMLVRVEALLPLATVLFGATRAAELLD